MSEQKVTIIDGTANELPTRRLYRSTTNRSVSGVCGGLAEYFGVDAGLVRALWLLSVLFSFGASLLVYVLLAVLIPEEPPENAATKPAVTNDWWQRIKENRVLLLGAVLVLAGLLLLLNNLDFLPWRLEALWNVIWAVFWPLLLIGLGIALLLGLNGRSIQWDRLQDVGAGLPLRRSRSDRVLAGVCGGLGAYLHIDTVLIRLGWVLLTIVTAGVVGVLLYAAATLFIPLEGEG